MRYHVEDLEDQLLTTLRADTNLTGVNIQTHAGEVTMLQLRDPAYMQGLITQLPFIFVKYMGKELKSKENDRDSTGYFFAPTLTFRFYAADRSLRAAQEAQRGCYSLLRSIYDDVHGKVPYSNPQKLAGIAIDSSRILSGDAITLSGFNPLSTFLMAGGQDERLIVDLPDIKVYQTDYSIWMAA